MEKPVRRASWWIAVLLMTVGTVVFGYGAFKLVSSALGSLTGAIIVAAEIVASAALYGMFRRRWIAAFGPSEPWRSR